MKEKKKHENWLKMDKNDWKWMENMDLNYEKWDVIIKMWEFK